MHKLTEIVKALYDLSLAQRGVSALTGGTSQVEAVIVTNGGSGYTSAPTVIFSSGAAAGTAIVQNGVLVAITITNRGSGYVATPTVSFSGGGGTGAAATALMRATSLDAVPTVDQEDLPMLVSVIVSGVLYLYALQSGTDAESSPDVIRPDDYAGTTNEKVWKLVYGGLPASGDQATVTLGNTDAEISGLTFSASPTQAECEALRDKCEELADDVRALSTLVHALRSALVDAVVIKGSA